MEKQYKYVVIIIWIGNNGMGIFDYIVYECSYMIQIVGKLDMLVFVDIFFCGDLMKYNSEDMLFFVFFFCYMFWYLYLCVDVGIIVIVYKDDVVGMMI